MKTVIIDDDPKAVTGLSNLLKEYLPQIEILATGSSVEEGIKIISRHKPELVFLDIEMNPGNGFDVIKAFEEVWFEVIFTTAYDEYAIKAIKYSALDYLIKPININELITATSRAERKISNNSRAAQFEVLKSSTSTLDFQRIALPSTEGLTIIDLKEILYLKAENNYTFFNLKNQEKLLVTTTLKEYETLLTGDGFFRVHTSYLVNLNEIQKYVKGTGGYIVMSDGTSIDVSVRRKAEFLKVIRRK